MNGWAVRQQPVPDGSNAGVLPAIMPMVKGMLTTGTVPAPLHKNLVVDARDILVEKPRHGAFQSTDLELILRSGHIDTIIITASPPASAAKRPRERPRRATFAPSS